jgi:hypothetical protein
MRMAQCGIASSGAFTRAGAGFTPMEGGRKRRPSFARKWGGGVEGFRGERRT